MKIFEEKHNIKVNTIKWLIKYCFVQFFMDLWIWKPEPNRGGSVAVMSELEQQLIIGPFAVGLFP